MQVTTFTYTQQDDGTVSFQRHDFKRKCNGIAPLCIPQPANATVLNSPTPASAAPAPAASNTGAPAQAAVEDSSASSATNDANSTAQHTTASAPTAPQETDTPKGEQEEDGVHIVTEELKDVGDQSSGAPAVLRDVSGDFS